LNFLVPLTATTNRIISIKNGLLKEGGDEDPSGKSHEMWAFLLSPTHHTICIGNGGKFVEWKQTVKFWVNPEAAGKIRERLTRKKPFVAELVREFLPKFNSLQDPNVNKYRGRILLDCTALLFPKVTLLKGKSQLPKNYCSLQ
jgi:hypothetical protein